MRIALGNAAAVADGIDWVDTLISLEIPLTFYGISPIPSRRRAFYYQLENWTRYGFRGIMYL